MTNLQVFELPELAQILGLDAAKAKNWINERTGIVIEPSVRKARGTGDRNLFSLGDLYLMGIAKEFNNAGFAPVAIGKLLKAVKPKLTELRKSENVTVWRLEPGGPFHVEQGRIRPETGFLWHAVSFKALLDAIDDAVASFWQARQG